jgi:DeoR/GlpR family transcriptional regulator of sugar metabolism
LRIAALPEIALQILAHVRNHGRVTIGDMIRLTGVSRNTLKEHFHKLVENGYIVRHGNGKG